MTKRSLNLEINSVAVDEIEIRFFNEAGGFIEEFTVTRSPWDLICTHPIGMSDEAWEALSEAEATGHPFFG